MAYPRAVEALIDALEKLPGIGRRSAERLAFHVLRDTRDARALSEALSRAASEAGRCTECRNLCEGDRCEVCADPERDLSLVAVVEEPRHVEALERAGVYRGRYHVLMGSLNPTDGTEERDLSLESLVGRLADDAVREVILATDPDREGEATALAVLAAVESLGRENLVVSRLARGLPAGSAIEYLHRGVLEDALGGRHEIRRRSR